VDLGGAEGMRSFKEGEGEMGVVVGKIRRKVDE
jgi:hypothetical protein